MPPDQTNTAEAVERHPLPWAYDYTTGVIRDGGGKTIARLAARVQTADDPFGAKTGGRIVDAVNDLDRLRSRITEMEKARPDEAPGMERAAAILDEQAALLTQPLPLTKGEVRRASILRQSAETIRAAARVLTEGVKHG